MATSVDTTPTIDSTAAPDPIEEVLGKIDEIVLLAAYLKRVVKPMLKKNTKAKRARGTPDPDKKSGLQAPVKLHTRLATFLATNFPDKNITADSMVPRTEVTQMMTTYIKSKELQIPENRKNFRVDTALSVVFDIEEGYVSNWFEMQKFMRNLLISQKDVTANASDATFEPVPAVTETPKTEVEKPGKRVKKGV